MTIRNNPNSLAAARDRMLEKLANKREKEIGHRGDLFIADYIPVDQHNARMLIGYEPRIGEASPDDVKRFILAQFDNDIVPAVETYKINTDVGAVSMFVRSFIPTRPLDDSKSMLAVAATQFLDQDLRETWEVRSGADGVKFLSRLRNDNISDIIAERKRRMAVQAKTVTFKQLASLAASKIAAKTNAQSVLDVALENEQLRAQVNASRMSSNVGNVTVGDTIEFYDAGHLLEGKVTAVHDTHDRNSFGTLDVKASDGAMFSIAKEAVTALLVKSESSNAEEKEKMEKYFEDAYGFKDYAKQLVED